MILVNNLYMKRIKANYNMKGIFYPCCHVLKFKNNNELISEEDIYNLFAGLYRLIKKSTEIEIEEKYLNRIKFLECELKKYKT